MADMREQYPGKIKTELKKLEKQTIMKLLHMMEENIGLNEKEEKQWKEKNGY